ncbi:MAG: VWA domain-containing protein [Actinobacteria bacterium]|nr:VWA domain-containing protein [Actinomycetota bacterium]
MEKEIEAESTEYDKMIMGGQGESEGIFQRLVRSFRSKKKTMLIRLEKGLEVDPVAWMLKLAKRFVRRVTIHELQPHAVSVLMDFSGSLSGFKKQMAYAVRCIGDNFRALKDNAPRHFYYDLSFYTDAPPVTVMEMGKFYCEKEWRARCVNMGKQIGNSGNNMRQAMEAKLGDFIGQGVNPDVRRARLKTLILFSDGQDDAIIGGDNPAPTAEFQMLLNQYREAGIEIFAIGFGGGAKPVGAFKNKGQHYIKIRADRPYDVAEAVAKIMDARSQGLGVVPDGDVTEFFNIGAEGIPQINLKEQDMPISSEGIMAIPHGEYHTAGRFAETIAKIGQELEITPVAGEYDFRKFLTDKRVTEYEQGNTVIRIEDDGVLTIIDPRFGKDHAGRRRMTVYARNKAKAQHELAELRAWIKYAEDILHITRDDIKDGKLTIWMAYPANKKTVEELYRRHHVIGLIAEVAYNLGVDLKDLDKILAVLDNEAEAIELKEQILNLLKEDGEISEDGIKILGRNTGKALDALDKIIGEEGIPALIKDDKRQIVQRFAMYISLLDLEKNQALPELPQCIAELRDVLNKKALETSYVPEIIKNIITAAKDDWRLADIYLRQIAVIYSADSSVQTAVEKARKYLYLKECVQEKLNGNGAHIEEVDQKRNVSQLLREYFDNRLNRNSVADITARYLTGDTSIPLANGIKGDIERIISVKKLKDTEYKTIPETSLMSLRQEIEGVLSNRIAAGKTTDYGADAVYLQDISLYVSDSESWDADNLDQTVASMLSALLRNKQILFMFNGVSDTEKKNRFVDALSKKSGIDKNELEKYCVDISGCDSYSMVKDKASGQYLEKMGNISGKRFVSTIAKESDTFRSNNLLDRVIIAGSEDKGVIDTYLVLKVSIMVGNLQDTDFNMDGKTIVSGTFEEEIKSFLKEYYKGTELAEKVDEIADKLMRGGNGLYILLPPISPFVRIYYDTLLTARSIIEKSA